MSGKLCAARVVGLLEIAFKGKDKFGVHLSYVSPLTENRGV